MNALDYLTGPNSILVSHENKKQNPVQTYFQNYEKLKQQKNWSELIFLGELALDFLKSVHAFAEEGKICSQLMMISYNQENYPQALQYAKRARELPSKAIEVEDFTRIIYLEVMIRSLSCRKNEPKKWDVKALAAKECLLHFSKLISSEQNSPTSEDFQWLSLALEMVNFVKGFLKPKL